MSPPTDDPRLPQMPPDTDDSPSEKCTYYLLVCRACNDLDDDPLVMPFGSAEERGKWAAAHARGTGHNFWYVKDEQR